MTLKTQMAADVTGVFLITDDFAETCQYESKDGGGARNVVCIVDEDDDYTETLGNVTDKESILVFCSSDITCSLGFINGPQLGDKLRREGDSPLRSFSFTGEVIDIDAASKCHTLRFQRPRLHKQGAR